MCVPSGGYVKYELTGTAPNRVLVCEFKLGSTSSASTATVNFQVQLHEADSKVLLVYGAAASVSSFQIGLSQSTTDLWLINPSTHAATHATTYSSTTYSVWPGENRYYAFERPVWTCFKPSKPVATLTPGNGSIATLTWEPNAQGTETAWVLQYGTDANFTDGTYTEVEVETTPSIDLTNLTAEQTYYARVKPDCDTDGTKWSTVSDAFTPTDAYVITVNEGTGSSSYVPIYYFYVNNSNLYTASQFIIPAADLTSIQWASIEKLTFYANTATASYGDAEFTVYVGETTATTQSAYTNWTTLTAVYTGTVSVSDNKMTIEFQTPFTYTTGNLLIGFKHTAVGTRPSSFTWKGVSGLTSGVSLYSSYSATPYQQSFLPQMTIEFTPGEAPSCLPPTGLDVTAAGQDATFTWESDATQWQVAYSTSATANPDDNIAALVNTKYFSETLAIDNDYYFWVRTYCSATEQSMWAGPASVHIGYCNPAPIRVDNGGITNVTFGSGNYIVNNNTHSTIAPTYSNYSSQIGAVQAGVESTIAITYATGYSYNTYVWVDLNNDLSFGADEVICYGESADDSPTTLTLTFTIPTTQALGDFRLRIGGADSGLGSNPANANPCYTGDYGIFEDYTLRVLEAPSCMMPTNLTLSRNNDQITATWEGTADTYNIDINGTVTNNVTSPYVFTAQLSTTYTVKVQANCPGDETSDWTNTKSITTPDCWNGRVIEYTLTDSYNDGWESASITVVEGCGNVVATLTTTGGTVSGTLNLCGDYYEFIYNTGTCCDSEHNWTFTEGGETLFTKPSSLSDGQVLYTIGTQLPMPTNLAATPDVNSLELNWNENGNAEAWQICVNGDEDNLIDITISDVTIDQNKVTYPLNGLTENTPYNVKVRAYTTEMQSCWTDEETFTTLALCPVPVMNEATNIGHYTATVSWTDAGDNPPYTVSYRVAGHYDVELTEDFSGQTPVGYNATGGELPNGWYSYNSTSTAPAPRVSDATNYNHGGMSTSNYGTGDNFLLLTTTSNSQYAYAIMPQYSNLASVSFDYVYESTSNGTLTVGYVTNNMGYTTYQDLQTPEKKATKTHFELTATDIATINANNGYIAFRYESGSGTYYAAAVDNIAIAAGNFNEGGVWNEVPATAIDGTTASLSGLSMGMKYDVKVAVSCGSESETVSFTTVSENQKYFLGTESDEWLEAGNWEPAGAPTYEQTVELRANTTITGEATAKTIDQSTYAITIEDGGKLKTNSSVNATVKKNINAWTVEGSDTEKPNGYYLIANPITSNYNPTEENGFLVGNYDLYNWSYDAYDGNEWRNYKDNAFTYLNSATYTSYGYLYANEAGTTLTFNGNIKAANATNYYKACTVPTSGSYDFPGVYLLGNGFVCDAYLAASSATGNGLPCYKMNEAGDGFTAVAAGEAIDPLEGVFFVASSEEGGFSGDVYVTTTAPQVAVAPGELDVVVSQGRGVKDNAIIVFGDNQKLGKFSFREGSSKVYIPMEGKDYAVVNAGNVGEMPVSFEAEHNGSYTLSFNSKEVSFSYLHLIDNLTGADVDLLANPSYSFDARTTDYASRFRLVFATGSSATGDNFGFINGMGNLCIFGIDGTATVQVIDVTGRMLSSETFSGSYERKLNVAPGVYMIRLINGNDVKVQKMIVK